MREFCAKILLAGIMVVVLGGKNLVAEGTKISREMIQGMFQDMRSRANWDIDGVCLWGYFFTDANQTELEDAGHLLEQRGYRFVGLLKPSAQDDDQDTLYLHVERPESHSVDSLLRRNDELYAFAAEAGLANYDGMDVGPLASGKCDPTK